MNRRRALAAPVRVVARAGASAFVWIATTDRGTLLRMSVQLNHTIVACRDAQASATWLAELLGLPAPTTFYSFQCVETANGVTLDHLTSDEPFEIQHYAFLVTEREFDTIFGRMVARGLPYWADPAAKLAQQINRNDGGRGVYFRSPDGHYLELLTRPYGSGPINP